MGIEPDDFTHWRQLKTELLKKICHPALLSRRSEAQTDGSRAPRKQMYA